MTHKTASPLPEEDRALLCALFDGELDGDRARFALKRLGHDPAWRATCERWQIAGDALRSRGAAFAADGLAERVAAAVASEAPRRGQSGSRHWRFGGLALAASFAAAAVLLMRPMPESPTAHQAGPVVARAATPRAIVTSPPSIHSAALAGSAEALPATSPPRPAAASRSARIAPARRPESTLPAGVTAPPPALVADTAAGPADPFQSPASIPTRPWPRAALPGSGGVFGVSHDGPAAAPSFHPFQPQPAPQDGLGGAFGPED